ncbi:hypothetical protein LP419_27455 [Massilia sp. H-1]|nr:hypothetical protein LP419_27455 [Massilia sp. H-1]
MAIRVAPGQESQFVVGDNIVYYFEGYTQTAARRASYQIRNETVFSGYRSSGAHDNQLAGAAEQVLPYGHRVRHADGATEEMALLSKQQAVAIRVTSAASAVLSVSALLPPGGAVTRDGEVQVRAPGPGKVWYTAIAADRPAAIGDDATVRSRAPAAQHAGHSRLRPQRRGSGRQGRALAATDAIGLERRKRYAALTRSMLVTSDAEYNKALNWAKAASSLFVVEEFGTGIWARSLPWFHDNWGRDTFIALPGTLLVTGQFGDAKAVLSNFARYQNLKEPRDKEYGRIPNRIAQA